MGMPFERLNEHGDYPIPHRGAASNPTLAGLSAEGLVFSFASAERGVTLRSQACRRQRRRDGRCPRPVPASRRFIMIDVVRAAVRWRTFVWSAAVCLAVAPALRAQTQANWLGTTDGSWTDPTRWSTNPNFPNNGTPAGAVYAANITTS